MSSHVPPLAQQVIVGSKTEDNDTGRTKRFDG